jgi:hypothetical protein
MRFINALQDRVSSPRAGVHRCRRHRPASRSSIFPARGGSPPLIRCTLDAAMYLPRARGFTGGFLGIERLQRVSSPRAGVYRMGSTNFMAISSIFPARGGSPFDHVIVLEGAEYLPRARGFTDWIGSDRAAGTVSSPRAGVHRRTRSGCSACTCIFPARGGSPVVVMSMRATCLYLPRARGHKIRRSTSCSALSIFPPRGGSPFGRYQYNMEDVYLPRTRGSPFPGPAYNRIIEYLPRAGVHRCSQANGRKPDSILPASGGSPSPRAITRSMMPYLPGARGYHDGHC